MTDNAPISKLRSLMPLAWAGLFMLCGILVLVYLGRDTARLMNGPLGEIELVPLLEASDRPTTESLVGKVAVIHFWGTWCPPCRQEYPEFVELHRKFVGDSKVAVLSVGCSPEFERDLDELRTETKNYLDSLRVSMPIYADPNMFTRGRITRMLAAGGFAYPFTVIVDGKGIVRDYWSGYSRGAMAKAADLVTRLTNESSRSMDQPAPISKTVGRSSDVLSRRQVVNTGS